jgi:hypothetical protein
MLSLKQGHVRIGTSALEGALAGQVGSFEEGADLFPLGRQTNPRRFFRHSDRPVLASPRSLSPLVQSPLVQTHRRDPKGLVRLGRTRGFCL